MKKYPLPLNSGKECIILEGFGDKICKLIDENLQKFLSDGGVLHPPSDDEDEIEYYEQYDKRASEKSTHLSEDDDILAAIDTNTFKSTKKTSKQLKMGSIRVSEMKKKKG